MTADCEPSPGDLRLHGLTGEEYRRIRELLGRAPNDLETALFGAMWSEHCAYKSSRHLLGRLPSVSPRVIHGPGENAGVVAIGDGDAVLFKIESHNHPSRIEPFQGAATGVGGILRDILTMGARPVALLNAILAGDPAHPDTPRLFSGIVSGIGHYGNCVGVPTVGGLCQFHASRNRNCLVNAMAVGIARESCILTARADTPGARLVCLGARTGRDGVRGAVMASTSFSTGGDDERPSVQVGNPFTGKLLIEALLEVMQTGAIIGIQDMGAAGLTSSAFEMAARGGMGLRIDLDAVPLRESGMTAREIMLSESQERMLAVLRPGSEETALGIFRRRGLCCALIGEVTGRGDTVRIFCGGERVCDLPAGLLTGGAPALVRPVVMPPPPPPLPDLDDLSHPPVDEALLRLLRTPELCSRHTVHEQFDSTVMADTLCGPGGDAGLVRVHGSRKALALTVDVTPRYVAADPLRGGMQAVAEAWRNICACGAQPLAFTNCLNFGDPSRPVIMGQMAGAVEGMRRASLALDFPVVSGNVSLYNETDGCAILPAPVTGGVGLVQDFGLAVSHALPRTETLLFLVGETRGEMGQSAYLACLFGIEAGAPPPVDLAAERAAGEFIRDGIARGHILACHDISDGGLLVALAEMCLAGGSGAGIRLPAGLPGFRSAFGEDQGRYLAAVAPDGATAFCDEAGRRFLPVLMLGKSGGEALTIDDFPPIPLEVLAGAHRGEWLPWGPATPGRGRKAGADGHDGQ